MKSSIIFLLIMLPFLTFSQTFSESMDKIQTVAYLNKLIKPEGQQANLSSNRTKLSFSDNFFANNSRKVYDFDLSSVTFKVSGTKIIFTCKSGECIQYRFQSPSATETKTLSTFGIEVKDAASALKAFNHLKKLTGAL